MAFTEEQDMNPRIGLTCIAFATATLGCTPQPTAPVPVVEEKVYKLDPGSGKVAAGPLSGEITEMQIIERVEKESGKVVAPARLTAKLNLVNASTDQTVRLIGGTVRFLDAKGGAVANEETRRDVALKFSTYGGNERLDPGQAAAQSISVDFPAAGLASGVLGGISVDLTYIPSAFAAQTLGFKVSIGK